MHVIWHIRIARILVKVRFAGLNVLQIFVMLHGHDFPVSETRHESEVGHLLRIDYFNAVAEFLEGRSNDRLILDRVQRTGTVSHFSAHFEQLDSSLQNDTLNRVQRGTVLGVPALPFLGNLANGCVTAAGHITDNPVEKDARIGAINIRIGEGGEVLGHVVDDHDVGRVQAIHLMRQHEGTFGVGVVRHNEAFGYIDVGPLVLKEGAGHHQL